MLVRNTYQNSIKRLQNHLGYLIQFHMTTWIYIQKYGSIKELGIIKKRVIAQVTFSLIILLLIAETIKNSSRPMFNGKNLNRLEADLNEDCDKHIQRNRPLPFQRPWPAPIPH